MTNQNCGIIFLALGEKWINEFIDCKNFLTQTNPSLNIALFTTEQFLDVCNSDHHVAVYKIDEKRNPFKLKTEIPQKSPYSKSLFLDTDTFVLDEISEIFDFLDESDFCIAKAPHYAKGHPPVCLNYEHPKIFNTGVFAWKKNTFTDKLFNTWNSAISKLSDSEVWTGNHSDQKYFNDIIKSGFFEKEGGILKILDNKIYNMRPFCLPKLVEEGHLSGTKILHTRKLGFGEKLNMELVSRESMAFQAFEIIKNRS